MCGVEPCYFALATDAHTTRTVMGSGTSWLRMPPYVCGSLLQAEYVAGWSFVPEYAEIKDRNGIQWLKIACGYFEENVIELTALWGWEAIPDDIVEATIETAMAIWRQSDAAFLRVAADLNGQGGVSGQAMPERAKLICAQWKRKLEPVFA
jgi:hypothetical protein